MRMIELYEGSKNTKAQQKRIMEIMQKFHCKLDDIRDENTTYWIMNHPIGESFERDAFKSLKANLPSGNSVYDVTEQFA
jgi:hypothetical protein